VFFVCFVFYVLNIKAISSKRRTTRRNVHHFLSHLTSGKIYGRHAPFSNETNRLYVLQKYIMTKTWNQMSSIGKMLTMQSIEIYILVC